MKLQKKQCNWIYLIWIFLIAFLLTFIVLPFFIVFSSTTKQDFFTVFSSKIWLKTILNTVIECICSSSLSVIIGFLYAYAIVKANIPFKKFFKIVPLIHLITPPFVGGLSFILLLGRQGFITHQLLGLDVSIYGFWGLLIAQTLCFFPMGYLICVQTLQNINTNIETAAKSLGASNSKIFWNITLPLSSTGILSALLFIAVSVLSDFGNPLIVAGRFRVLSVEIYTQLTGWLNVGVSAVLGIILIIPSIILFILQNKLLKQNFTKFSTIGDKNYTENQSGNSCSKFATILLFLFVSFISLIIFAQFISIIAGSFQKLWGINTSFTFEHILSAIKYTKEISNTLLFSLFSALISVFIAIISSFIVHRSSLPLRKLIDTLIQIPSAIPGSLLGLSLSLTANRIHFRGSIFLIIISMIIAFLPFAYKAITANFFQLKSSLDDGAKSLGAKPFYLLKTILVPLSYQSIFSGFIYSFIRGVGTVSAVIFLVSFNTPLASVRILNLAEQAFWGKAAALALLLTIITFLILGISKIITNIYYRTKKWK